jgi:transcriptional antiterminator NusG
MGEVTMTENQENEPVAEAEAGAEGLADTEDVAETDGEPAEPERDLSHMKWYVVNTYSGYEMKAKLALEERARSKGLTEKLGEILVPTEQVVEVRRGQKRTSTRKFFPGYMLIQMDLDSESWHLVKDTPKVTGFVGGTTNPPPIPPHEVARITDRMKEVENEPTVIHSFSEGDSIKVVDGPFSNFSGSVEQVDEERKKVKVLVQIFGRDTPVELEFAQVEKN